jgi:hypothetical protein
MTAITVIRNEIDANRCRMAASPYAQLSSPALVNGEYRIATDLGPEGTLVKSNGVMFVPESGEALLGKSDIYIGIAPTFTARAGGAAGKVTFGTALVRTGGIKGYFYYAANTLDTTHAAGFYYTVMTDGTSGTVYSDTYTPGGVEPTIPASPTAFPGTVVGGAGVITEVTLVSNTLPAGCMGKIGQIEYATQLENNNNGDDKTLKVKLGTTVLSTTLVTTVTETAITGRVWNAGATNVQVSASTSFAGTVDTTAASTVSITATLEVATSWALIPFSQFVLKV